MKAFRVILAVVASVILAAGCQKQKDEYGYTIKDADNEDD